MEDLCGSVFWDRNLTWDTTDPYFTTCFEETLFIWAPVGFLLILAPFDIFLSFQNSKNRERIPWNLFTGLKIGLACGLFGPAIYQFVNVGQLETTHTNYYLAPALRIFSYILFIILLVISKLNGVRSSGTQSLFWLFSVFCEAILFRTALRQYDTLPEGKTLESIVYSMRYSVFPLVCIQFILHFWADGAWESYCRGSSKKQTLLGKQCPEKFTSFFGKNLYLWYDSMAWRGYKNPLDFEDMWDLNEIDKASHQVPIFLHHWDNAVKAAKEKSKTTGKPARVNVIWVLAKCYGLTFMFGGVMKFAQDMMAFVSPEILKLLVAHVSPSPGEEPEPAWKGYLYAAVLFLSSFIITMFNVQHNKRMLTVGMRIRTVLSSAVYRKALVVSNEAKKESTVGEIVNLMSVDAQRLMDLAPFLHMAWTAPIQIGVSLYFLYNTLGWSIFSGLTVMLLLIPLNGVVAARVRILQMDQMVLKDDRVKLMSELLSGMKVLKLYGWEESFQEQILKIRAKEIKLLRKMAWLNTSTVIGFTSTATLVALATFATFLLSDSSNSLNAENSFVSLTLFNIMRMPMTMFPMCVALIIQASVSVKRLNKYMNSEDLDLSSVSNKPSKDEAITVKDGSFSWMEDTVTLKNINLEVKKGSLTAIVGAVGSGKTSLLCSILGDLKKHSGTVNVDGSTAYVAQGAWIQNATLKDNILFNDAYVPEKYKNVIEACSLGPDLKILDAGDQTEIGEKGINLSGGQKQRVSLARAAYKESDIYLWDDPLSAVDAHVGKHIFDHLIGPDGILSKKTRVLVTHGVSWLPKVDHIVVMNNGSISEQGTFKELLAKKGSFSEFLAQHLNTTEEEGIDHTLLDEMEEVVGAEPLVRSASTVLKRQSTRESVRSKTGDEKVDTKKPVAKLIEEEKTATGNIKLSVVIDYVRAAGAHMVITALIFNVLSNAVLSYSNIWLSEWSTQATIDEISLGCIPGPVDEDQSCQYDSTTNKYLAGYGGLALAQTITIFIASATLAIGSLNGSARIHLKVLKNVMRAPMSYFDTTPLGRLVNRFAKDVDTTDLLLPLNIRATLTILMGVGAAIFNIAYSTPIFLAFIVPTAIVYFFIQRFYVTTSRQLRRIESVTRSPIYSKFGETISGATTIRAFGLQDDFIQEAEKKINQNQQAFYPYIASTLWIAVRLETIGSLIILAAAIFAVVGRDSINGAIIGLSVSSALQMTQMLNFLVRVATELETNIVAVERLQELNDTPKEAPWILDQRPPKDWPQTGQVTFNDYQTRYREGLELVLKGITCNFAPGEKIGIVGRTGAGKSSLTLALFRLVEPAGGKITIDGIDVTKIGLHDLRSRITIIPQDPVLFSGNLRINLDPFNSHTDEEVWNSLESAHLKSFVSELQGGLLHEVAEEGQNFSVGQRQLVCLARALLRKTKILVLDEATAAVDLETDDLIQKTIRTEFADSTVITIAHRLNTIMDSTRVVVLDKGEIVEFDTPEALLKNPQSIFCGMAKDAGITASNFQE